MVDQKRVAAQTQRNMKSIMHFELKRIARSAQTQRWSLVKMAAETTKALFWTNPGSTRSNNRRRPANDDASTILSSNKSKSFGDSSVSSSSSSSSSPRERRDNCSWESGCIPTTNPVWGDREDQSVLLEQLQDALSLMDTMSDHPYHQQQHHHNDNDDDDDDDDWSNSTISVVTTSSAIDELFGVTNHASNDRRDDNDGLHVPLVVGDDEWCFLSAHEQRLRQQEIALSESIELRGRLWETQLLMDDLHHDRDYLATKLSELSTNHHALGNLLKQKALDVGAQTAQAHALRAAWQRAEARNLVLEQEREAHQAMVTDLSRLMDVTEILSNMITTTETTSKKTTTTHANNVHKKRRFLRRKRQQEKEQQQPVICLDHGRVLTREEALELTVLSLCNKIDALEAEQAEHDRILVQLSDENGRLVQEKDRCLVRITALEQVKTSNWNGSFSSQTTCDTSCSSETGRRRFFFKRR